jgi:glycosyltransferase involved in cell wall biosynthesis
MRHYSEENEVATNRALISVISLIDDTTAEFSETVRAMRGQSLECIEWLIVDSSGDDGRLADLLSELRRSDHVRVLPDSAGGQAGMQAAFRESSGSYICFLDAGFTLDPTFLEKCVWFLHAEPNFVFCGSITSGTPSTPGKDSSVVDGIGRVVDGVTAATGAVFRRSALEKRFLERRDPPKGLEFEDIVLSLAAEGLWGFTIPECLRSSPTNGRNSTPDARIPDLSSLISEKYPTLINGMPEPARWQPEPYAPLRKDFPTDSQQTRLREHRNILFVVPWMVVGGADKFNLDLVGKLAERGYGVTLCATLQANHDWHHLFREHTSDVFVLRNFLGSHDAPRFLSYLIKSRGVSAVVIAGSTLGYQLLPYVRANAPDVAFLDLNHIEEPHWQSGGHPRFGAAYRDLLDLHVVSTHHLAQWMISHGVDAKRVRVVYTGVEQQNELAILSTRRKVRTELGIAEELPVIIFGGRISRQKRPEILAQILSGLLLSGLEFRALIVGDGDRREDLERLMRELGLQHNVLMLGSVPHQRWLQLLHASDVFLLPSEHEGISIALLEALAAGIIPVVSEVGGQAEIVQEENGFLVSVSKEEIGTYVKALTAVLSSKSLRKQMGHAARQLIAERFSGEATISFFEEAVEEACSSRTRSVELVVPEAFSEELAISAIEIDRLNHTVSWLHSRGALSHEPGKRTWLRNWVKALLESSAGRATGAHALARHFVERNTSK